jgi:hypothetical protein
MTGGPRSLGWTVAAIVLGALFTFVLWTLVTGDAGTGAAYGGIVLVVLAASALLERRRREAERDADRRTAPDPRGARRAGKRGSTRDRG